MVTITEKHHRRIGKAASVRRRLRQHSGRPRLCVCRSLKNISCQVIDDIRGHTLVAASSLEKEVREAVRGMRKTDVAKKVGALLAERCQRAGVVKVAFDRGAFKYHGRVQALAEAARSGGLQF
jgi:large subunit ribosomal protein L18